MDYSSPQKLWARFQRDIAAVPTERAPLPEETLEDVLKRVKDLALKLPPQSLHVIDQSLFEGGIRALSQEALDDFAREMEERTESSMSREDAQASVFERYAVLQPVELLSSPYPEVRALLVGRFGANSVVAGLRDIYDFEPNERVKGIVIQAMHGRISCNDILERERQESFSFAEEILQRGYYEGKGLIPARAAFYLLADLSSSRIPRALRIPFDRFSNPRIDHLDAIDRTGFVRILGERAETKVLLQFVTAERDDGVLMEILKVCDARWGRGVLDPNDVASVDSTRELWGEIAAVMVNRLGWADLQPESLRVVLSQEMQENEPPWRGLLRKLALVALEESSGF